MTDRETEIRDAVRRSGWTEADWHGPAGDRHLIAARHVGGTWLAVTVASSGAVLALSAVGTTGRTPAPASRLAEVISNLARAWAVADIGEDRDADRGHPFDRCACSDPACPCGGVKFSRWPIRV